MNNNTEVFKNKNNLAYYLAGLLEEKINIVFIFIVLH